MKLKYASEVSKFNCDLQDFAEQNRIAYRWVFEDINDVRNFEPVYSDPKRIQNTCLGYALSFFDEQASAKSRLLHFAKDKINVFKKLGTHIAEGNLIEMDGISKKCDENKHFSHFEYENITLNSKFQIIEKIA